ncbi:Asp-tRNA(Asn)/Glu-tRNA(Gln) amidotransferase subunit GatA [Candidatus Dojkabacteria bacterium]|uniref:Glutamyl-tRNA(Gln) amidotransferase subunit A n=1 Tax=Candidatus Dojkabacteria bacterium TaxID=2099670 RepID=A0A3M0Z4B5_9BACT|nr:MAG: Asp-tRNA(Asn)/Glu-tRNA(Gln) amidotransferase subunit GatA [Candidatus Dojkabacteria bacterium]
MNSLSVPERESIDDIRRKIINKEIDILSLTEEHLKLAESTNEKINSFITILKEEATKQAKELQKVLEQNPNKANSMRLFGVPFTVKDLYLVKSTRTTFASKLMEDFISPYTATVVQKCLDEGAILIGKTNCDPWGFGASGENSGFGPTRHPLDFNKTPGGSSSGSAASLLSGVGYFSLGTDTGGSVRLPASFCGLFGYKPTYGRNSRYGVEAMGSSFDTPGFFARYIDDIVLLEEIMQGKDLNDATTSETKDLKINRKPIIGVPREFFVDGIDPQVDKVIKEKMQEIKQKGFEIVDVSIPSTKYALPVYYVLVPSEISSNRARYDGVRFGKKVSNDYSENLVKSRSIYLEPEVKRRIMIGTFALSAGYSDQYYNQASRVRTKLKKEFDAVFQKVDLLVSPVSPTTAFDLGEKSKDPVQMYLVDIYTVTANLVGIPAISFPIGKNNYGMPIGMQIMAPKWADMVMLNFVKSIL